MDDDFKKKPLGRPTDYCEEYNNQAYRHCLLGATDEDLAALFDVCVSTIDNWKLKYPEFLGAIKRGKLDADSRIAESLFNRAKGYSHPEEKVFCNEGQITTYDTIKHYPPDTAAAMSWLTNRQPDRWRHRSEQKHLGKDGESLVPIINVGGGTQS